MIKDWVNTLPKKDRIFLENEINKSYRFKDELGKIEKKEGEYYEEYLTNYLQGVKDGKITDDELDKEFYNKLIKEKSFEYDAPFNLSTEFWFSDKTPDQLTKKDIPAKLENEGIFEYMMRVQKALTVMGIELPSTLTGKQFEKDFDINKVLIGIPE